MKLKYIVVGTGRCGTVYMARLLTSLGIPCVHEGIFDYNGLELAYKKINEQIEIQTSYCSTNDLLNGKKIEKWINPKNTIAESSYMAAPFLDDPILNETKIIHITRNPLKVISSLIADAGFFDRNPKNDAWLNFVYEQMPEIKSIKNLVEKTCLYYLKWNELIENKCTNKKYIRHKIEDGANEKLFEFLGIDLDKKNIFMDTQINSWKKRKYDLTLKDIPNGSIKKEFLETMFRYGYKIKKSII